MCLKWETDGKAVKRYLSDAAAFGVGGPSTLGTLAISSAQGTCIALDLVHGAPVKAGGPSPRM